MTCYKIFYALEKKQTQQATGSTSVGELCGADGIRIELCDSMISLSEKQEKTETAAEDPGGPTKDCALAL